LLTLAEIDRRLFDFYGEVDWSAATGVVHVAAIESTGGAVIVPGPGAPASEIDRFVLGIARARADAIVTTGAILRSEPGLRHDLAEDEEDNRALLAWRRERLGKTSPPILIVLSGSGDFPVDHPAIQQAVGGFIWTSEAGATHLRAGDGFGSGNLEIIEGAESTDGIFAALAATRAWPGVDTILLEAGPTVSKPLYSGARADAPTPSCDELLLNSFQGDLPSGAIGPDFVSAAAIDAHFSNAPHEVCVCDASGEWRLARYRLRPT